MHRPAAERLAVCCQLHNFIHMKPHSMLGRIMANMEVPSKDCQHHWVIDPADGPVSSGVCKFCRKVREFENFVGGNKWGYFNLTATEPVSKKVSRRQSKAPPP